MPRRFKKKNIRRRKTYRKKRYNRRKRANASTMTVRRPTIVADRTFVRLRYNEIATLSSATYDGSYAFSGNGIYDPNISSTGTQPTGYDQWSNFYSQYRVRGSKIKIKVANISGTSSVIIGVVPCIDYVNTASGGINEVIRDPRCKYTMLSSGGQTLGFVSNYNTTKKTYGENDLSDTLYVGASGNSGSNPTNQWYWCIDAANVSGSGSISLQMHVEITYYVEFFKRKDLDVS